MISHWRRARADPADWFDAAEVERGRAYNRPLDRLRLARAAGSMVIAVVLVIWQFGPRTLDYYNVIGWPLQVVVMVFVLEVVGLAYSIGIDYWREMVYDKRWDLSTQTVKGFFADQAKGFVVSMLLTVPLMLGLYAVIIATDWWWLYGWLLFSAFTVLIGLLYPVLIAPIFNKFTPLADEALTERILAVARLTGLDVTGVSVADASRRSKAGNAYVAGLGRTRRVVVFDTILDWPPEVVGQVVAHELGHWRHAHLRRKLPVLIAAQLVMFATTWSLLRWEPLLDVAGVTAASDPGSLPLLLAVFPLTLLLTKLGAAWLSRADERQADVFALDTLADPEAFSELFRRLAERNKADIDPSRWKRVTASHPPIAERLAMARQWALRQPVP